jgi:anti-sigma factor RsiW
MTHLGQRLSALIDGELDSDDRDRVLGHLARCDWCRDEAAAMRTLKRRMNALGEAAAGAGLTGRLMGLSADGPAGMWPQPAGWPHAATSWPPAARPDTRAGRYLLAGSVVVFLASVGTAAFIAGGSPQAQAPSPQVTPAVGAYLLEHANVSGLYLNGLLQPNLSGRAQPTTRKPGSESPSSRLP